MNTELNHALSDPKWKDHQIGDVYSMVNANGKTDYGWKIAYYPLFGTYKDKKWIEFNEPRVLIEKPIEGGIDFREVPFRYLINQNKSK